MLDFYKAFEDKHRGSRELIKSRLRVYLPLVLPIKQLYPDAKIIDLGCGRGEWLELLKEHEIDAVGVDLNAGMLDPCKERGLCVSIEDAIECLKRLSDSSQIVVSGFHLAEHIPFSDLQILVQEALRVLKPAGLLILETPNPENIVVGATNFYVDPTHKRPIPSQLLSFLPEYYGFRRVKIIRLQESKALVLGGSVNLADVLSGVSPDYAVVAQKDADDNLLSAIDVPFNQEYGLTLSSLAERYNQQIESSLQLSREISNETHRKLETLEERLITVLDSRSMRVTAPLRWAAHTLRSTKVLSIRLTKAIFHKIVPKRCETSQAVSQKNSQFSAQTPKPSELTPTARCIYRSLKAEIEKQVDQ